MFVSLVYLLFRRALAVAALRVRSREFKELEIVVLRHELAILQRKDDDYLFHEYLEDDNQPFYFHQFIRLATGHHLQYLGEANFAGMQASRELVPYAEALARRFATDWKTVDIAVPGFLGPKVLPDIPLGQIVPFIDWSPFFQTWELKGKYPAIFEDAVVGTLIAAWLVEVVGRKWVIVLPGMLAGAAIIGFTLTITDSGVARWAQERSPYLLYGMNLPHPPAPPPHVVTASAASAP